MVYEMTSAGLSVHAGMLPRRPQRSRTKLTELEIDRVLCPRCREKLAAAKEKKAK